MIVLIVEDSIVIRKELVSTLSRILADCNILQTGNGIEAINLIRRYEVQVAIIDIQLPGINGLEVLRHLKTINPSCLAAIFTNCNHQPYRQKCAELGADLFFDKSAEFELMCLALESWFCQRLI